MGLNKDMKQIEKQISQEIKHAEMWIVERRKFLVKLLGVIGFIALLLILLNLL